MATSTPTVPAAQLVQLPCTRCGTHATTLRLPEVPPKATKMLLRLIDAADGMLGLFGDFQMPKIPKEGHPLAAFAPEDISLFLGVIHPECAAALEAESR